MLKQSKPTLPTKLSPIFSPTYSLAFLILIVSIFSFASSAGWTADSAPELVPMVHQALGFERRFDLRHDKKGEMEAFNGLTLEQKKRVDDAEKAMRKIAPEIIEMQAEKEVLRKKNGCDAISESGIQAKLAACSESISETLKKISGLDKKIGNGRASLASAVGQYNYLFDPPELKNKIQPAILTAEEIAERDRQNKPATSTAQDGAGSKDCACPCSPMTGAAAAPKASGKATTK